MVSPTEMIRKASAPDEYIWQYQTCADPWDTTQIPEWKLYPDDTSSAIEKAYKRGAEETFINEIYRIDLKHFVQQHIDDGSRQRPIRRQHRFPPPISSDVETRNECRRRERLSFPLGLVSSRNTSVDTNFHGSPFITDWLLKFTKGKLKVTFDSIFPVLVQGLKHEGHTASENVVQEIVQSLNMVKDETFGKKDKKRVEKLQDCCVKLYTKDCYIYRVVNTALRDDDRTKLDTLGPYCYLVYNNIGRRLKDYLSIRHRLRQAVHPTESQSMIVYRGDHISREIIEEYRQAAGNNNQYFKWLSFVSTSLSREVAESFGCNVLYIIELQRHLTNDQFTNLRRTSFIEDEEEILLRPGMRFRVDKVEFDDLTGRQLVHIKIVPSYVFNLR
ncbi:unnamed protein product [Rotaria sordida]|uniref:WWE domain-containing protein n=1 Tax=Rotaria sordida TaxID=392033 RepID=A0A814RUN8_9BILA|nr:unnamed protein product [Rotaria sordida]